MILKGNQRAGGADLATHLLNEVDNEQIEIAEISGSVAQDLHGAFAEFAALATGTHCIEYLYSLSLNPPAPITHEQYIAAINRIEKRLGLQGQPRAIIFHIKHGTGREHAHVVWSRIDTAKTRAVQLSHDRMKLRTLARELAAEYGLALPAGLAEDRDIDRFATPELTRGEKSQAEQTGISPIERRAEITHAYRSADNAHAFMRALEMRGYFLAMGKRRAFVVVDRYGHVHSLARQIEGVKTRELKAFLADLEVHTLQEARRLARSLDQATEDRQREKIQARLADALDVLEEKQSLRRLDLTRQAEHQFTQHAKETAALHAAQQSERERPVARIFSAVLALFARIPALRSVLAHIHRKASLSLAERHRLEQEALARRHAREKQDIERQRRALQKVEERERRCVARALVRSVRVRGHKNEMFLTNAHDITVPSMHEEPPTFDQLEAELDRFYALLESGLSPPFNASAGLREKRQTGDDPFSEAIDPVEAALDREYALLEYGLTPQFNDSAGVKREPRSGDDEGLTPSGYQPFP